MRTLVIVFGVGFGMGLFTAWSRGWYVFASMCTLLAVGCFYAADHIISGNSRQQALAEANKAFAKKRHQ